MKNNYKVIINKIKCNYKIYTIKSLYKVITSQWNNKVITSFIQSTSFQNLFHLTYCILKLFLDFMQKGSQPFKKTKSREGLTPSLS